MAQDTENEVIRILENTNEKILLFDIGGYFAHGYADDMIPVEKIDPSDKTIHPAMQTVYGFMTGADWRRWYALNLLEELDLPGDR